MIKTCSYCGNPAEGHYSIHRDGFGVGPEVDLCDACGSKQTPDCYDIWERIAQPTDECPEFAHRTLTKDEA